MKGLILPGIILAASLVWLISYVRKQWRRKRVFEQAMLEQGFRDVTEDAGVEIDFTSTLQWPQARGIEYLCKYSRQAGRVPITVANVRCFETTGVRAGRLGAQMRVDEIHQTALGATVPDARLARFCLCPAHWEDQYRTWAEGGSELATGDAAFDEAFFMIGESDADVCRVLAEPVRQKMLACPGIMLAAGNDSVVIFRQADILLPEDVSKYVDVMETIAGNLGDSLYTPRYAWPPT